MGNIDSRSKFKSGYLMLMTDKPFYEPGEMITGKIYLRNTMPLDAKQIDLEVKGKEKGSWVDYEVKTVTEPNGQVKTERIEKKRKARREIMDYKTPCFIFPPQGLIPGDFVVPFSFQLPLGIPSSMFFKNSHTKAKPKAKVKYTIKAKIQTHSDKNEMSYKQVLIIREKPESY